MHVKSLHLERQHSWQSDPEKWGPMVGTLAVGDGKTNISMTLSPAQTQRIMSIVADSIVNSAKEIANGIAMDVITQAGGVRLLKDDRITDIPF